MVPILINEDVFEPSYNDVKFMLWNHNYFCTDLIEYDGRSLGKKLRQSEGQVEWGGSVGCGFSHCWDPHRQKSAPEQKLSAPLTKFFNL